MRLTVLFSLGVAVFCTLHVATDDRPLVIELAVAATFNSQA